MATASAPALDLKPMTCVCGERGWRRDEEWNQATIAMQKTHYHFSMFIILLVLIWHMVGYARNDSRVFDSNSSSPTDRKEEEEERNEKKKMLETKSLERTRGIFSFFGPKTIEIWIWIILITWMRDTHRRHSTHKNEASLVALAHWIHRPLVRMHHFSVRQTVSMSIFFHPTFSAKALKFMNFAVAASVYRSPFRTLINTFWCLLIKKIKKSCGAARGVNSHCRPTSSKWWPLPFIAHVLVSRKMPKIERERAREREWTTQNHFGRITCLAVHSMNITIALCHVQRIQMDDLNRMTFFFWPTAQIIWNVCVIFSFAPNIRRELNRRTKTEWKKTETEKKKTANINCAKHSVLDGSSFALPWRW